jgi:hypothetical protein
MHKKMALGNRRCFQHLPKAICFSKHLPHVLDLPVQQMSQHIILVIYGIHFQGGHF